MRKLMVAMLLLLLAAPCQAYNLGTPRVMKQFDGGLTLQTWLVGETPHRRQVVAIVTPKSRFDMVVVRFEEADGVIPVVAELWIKDMLSRLTERPRLAVVNNDGMVKLFALGSPEALAQLRAIHILPAGDDDQDQEAPDPEPSAAPAGRADLASFPHARV